MAATLPVECFAATVTDNKHYAYRVVWSAEDGEYVATVAELPSLSWLDEDQAGALRGLVKVGAGVVADREKNGETVPVPLAERRFSGKFNVRVPESPHRELAITAAEQRVSLNPRITSPRSDHRATSRQDGSEAPGAGLGPATLGLTGPCSAD